GVVMLLGGVDFNFHRAGVIFFQKILDRVEVVLAHIPQTTSIIVPIAPERGVGAVFAIGLPGRRSEPHVVIEGLWNGLGLEVGQATPLELPIEARGSPTGYLEGPAQEAIFDALFDGFDLGLHPVEAALKTKPGIQPKHTFVLLYRLDNFLTLIDGTGHGLFAPD